MWLLRWLWLKIWNQSKANKLIKRRQKLPLLNIMLLQMDKKYPIVLTWLCKHLLFNIRLCTMKKSWVGVLQILRFPILSISVWRRFLKQPKNKTMKKKPGRKWNGIFITKIVLNFLERITQLKLQMIEYTKSNEMKSSQNIADTKPWIREIIRKLLEQRKQMILLAPSNTRRITKTRERSFVSRTP